MILTAAYILWAVQRVYLGAEYHGPHPEALVPITSREFAIGALLAALAILFGVYPRALLDYMQPSVDKTVTELADWSRVNEPAKLALPTLPEDPLVRLDGAPAVARSSELGKN